MLSSCLSLCWSSLFQEYPLLHVNHPQQALKAVGANQDHLFAAMSCEDIRLLEPAELYLNPGATKIFVQDSEVFSDFLGFRSFRFKSDISLEVVVALWCGWHGYLVDAAWAGSAWASHKLLMLRQRVQKNSGCLCPEPACIWNLCSCIARCASQVSQPNHEYFLVWGGSSLRSSVLFL